MTMVGPGEKFSFTFAIGFQLFRLKDPNVGGRLRPLYVVVNWRSVGDRRVYSEKYLLNNLAYAGLPGIVENPPMVKIADELVSIRQHLVELTNSEYAKSRILDATNLEHSKRRVVPGAQGAIADE